MFISILKFRPVDSEKHINVLGCCWNCMSFYRIYISLCFPQPHGVAWRPWTIFGPWTGKVLIGPGIENEQAQRGQLYTDP